MKTAIYEVWVMDEGTGETMEFNWPYEIEDDAKPPNDLAAELYSALLSELSVGFTFLTMDDEYDDE